MNTKLPGQNKRNKGLKRVDDYKKPGTLMRTKKPKCY